MIITFTLKSTAVFVTFSGSHMQRLLKTIEHEKKILTFFDTLYTEIKITPYLINDRKIADQHTVNSFQ